ncbi:MAGUK p55 subfamily member 2-like isoform X2 [Convolutriloba macropyga]|uniref:MAGUK p55 subfamily member 2-like isoform X2 n=1 Tax=Convolutriloba macropyga TaxID=536237 RepID=UPI003F51F24E
MVEISTQTEFDQVDSNPFCSLSTQTTSTSEDVLAPATSDVEKLCSQKTHQNGDFESNCPSSDKNPPPLTQHQMQRRFRSSSLKSHKSRSAHNKNASSPFGANDKVQISSRQNSDSKSSTIGSRPKGALITDASQSAVSTISGRVTNSCSTDSESVNKTIFVVNQVTKAPPALKQMKSGIQLEAKSLKDLVSVTSYETALQKAGPNFTANRIDAGGCYDPSTEYMGYLECSHCGALSAKSLDKIHIVPTSRSGDYLRSIENSNQSSLSRSLATQNDLMEVNRTGVYNEFGGQFERSHSRHRAREVSDRRERSSIYGRSRSRSRNKHVHISNEVVSINNSLKRSKSVKSSGNNSANENCYDSIDFHNPIYIKPPNVRGNLKNSNTETNFWGISNNKMLSPQSQEESGPSSSLTTTDSHEGSLLSAENNVGKTSPNSYNTSINNVTTTSLTSSSNNFETSFTSYNNHHQTTTTHGFNLCHSSIQSSSSSSSSVKPKSLFPPFWKKVAIGDVVRGMGDLQYNAGASMKDLIFLRSLLENPVMHRIVRTHDSLDPNQHAQGSSHDAHYNMPDHDHYVQPPRSFRPVPVDGNLSGLSKSVAEDLERLGKYYKEASYLQRVLSSFEFIGVASAHDQIAARVYDETKMLPDQFDELALNDPTDTSPGAVQAVRVVGLRKTPGEPLGLTLKVEDFTGQLKVSRILDGGEVDKQGLLAVGDVVLQINGLDCDGEFVKLPNGDRQRVSEYLKNYNGDLKLAIQALSEEDRRYHTQTYMRALFSYNPEKDDLLPSSQLGLQFTSGDILEIVESQKDPNWWQARKYGEQGARARLIPSQTLEERRAAYARPDLIDTKKQKYGGLTSKKRKKKEVYSAKNNADFDRLDLTFYEEVARMPPFPRKTLVLIGTTGVGRRSIKNSLIKTYPDNFATPIPTTSRPMRDGEIPGKSYNFVSKQDMEQAIRDNGFLEYGEFQDNYYGTSILSIHNIIDEGKMCVLDCSPNALKLLRTAEFMPFVVLIASPPFERLRELRGMDNNINASTTTLSRLSDRDLKKTVEESKRLEQEFRQYIDLKIENEEPELTFRALCDAIARLSSEYQWVPVRWVM